MSKIDVEIEAVKDFRNRLKRNRRQVADAMVGIRTGLGVLRGKWKDSMFRRFEAELTKTLRQLKKFEAEADNYNTYLREKAILLQEVIDHRIPRG